MEDPLPAILRVKDVVRLTSLNRTSLWRRVRAGDFPCPIRLGAPGSRAVGWRASEVAEWVRQRPAA